MTSRAKMITGVGLGVVLGTAGVAALLMNTGDVVGSPSSDPTASAPGELVTVYRTPTCGCCKAWEDHLRESGYTVESVEMASLDAVKAEHHVPRPLQSCHTGVVDGYVVEGHVPAADIARLLSERPAVRGLAVPGMPVGSPGMEVPGRRAQPYEVYSFTDDGAAEVWAAH